MAVRFLAASWEGSRRASVGRSVSSLLLSVLSGLLVAGAESVPPAPLSEVGVRRDICGLPSSVSAAAGCGLPLSEVDWIVGRCDDGCKDAAGFGGASAVNFPKPYHTPAGLSSARALPVTIRSAICRSSSPAGSPERSTVYRSPLCRANGMGRARYRPASSKCPSINSDTGTKRAAVGLVSSPVHSYTPTARVTCSGASTWCICARTAAVEHVQRAKPATADGKERMDIVSFRRWRLPRRFGSGVVPLGKGSPGRYDWREVCTPISNGP